MGKEIDERSNGLHVCPFSTHWDVKEFMSTMSKVNEAHSLLNSLVENTSCLPTIADSNNEMKDYLMSAATGKNHVPLSVVERLIKLGGLVVSGLVFVIVFLLTGIHAGWIQGR